MPQAGEPAPDAVQRPASDVPAFEGLVLCGGASSRMGTDKSLLVVGGQAMAVGVAGVLGRAGAGQVHAQGGDGEALTNLGLHWVADRWPGRGPGIAVADALTDAAARGGADVIVVAACDHPGLDVDTVRALVDALGASDDAPVVAVAVAVASHRRHPTLSAWRTRPCADVAHQWLAQQGRPEARSSLTDLVGAVERHNPVVGVEVADGVARDLDSPDDVSRYDRDTPQVGRVRPAEEPTVDVPEIDVTSLAARLAAGCRLFDVRQPDEYAEVHVPGAELIPLAQVPDRVDDFAGDDTVYVICKSGARSARAVEYLRANDIDAVNVTGGTMAWVESGADTATGDQPG
jgi:molybdopterin-guanine dinucleotide biosynthesis protein A/rhodanese-related sulfurtransferase